MDRYLALFVKVSFVDFALGGVLGVLMGVHFWLANVGLLGTVGTGALSAAGVTQARWCARSRNAWIPG
jgi:hypothetical protein